MGRSGRNLSLATLALAGAAARTTAAAAATASGSAGLAVGQLSSRRGHSATSAAYPTFEEYLKMYRLSFSGSELEQRKALYEKELQKIQAHNARSDKTWTAVVNKFTALTDGEMNGFFGLKRGPSKPGFDVAPFSAQAPKEVPEAWDWRTHQPPVSTSVKDQGHCGSCWAFAATAALESAVAITTGTLWNLSPQQITSCTPNPNYCGGHGGCTGATAQLAFSYVKGAGIASEWAYSYSSYYGESGTCKEANAILPVAGIGGFRNVPPNLAQSLIEAVLTTPVVVSVAAGLWRNYATGIFGYNDCDLTINHAVVLMGFGVDGAAPYWLIRNSWGPTWGEDGYIRLQRAGAGQDEQCGWDTDPLVGSQCEKPLDGSETPEKVWVCGTCGMLSDSSYPVGAFLGAPVGPSDPALDNTSLISAPAKAHDFGGLPEGADGAAFLQTPAVAGGQRRPAGTARGSSREL